MFHVTICDDIALHRDHTEILIKEYFGGTQVEIECFCQGNALLESVKKDGYRPDIAILDIKMDDIDGIQLARELNQLLPSCQIIYLTAYLDYATEVYTTAHSYFVLKQQMDHRLGEALDKACLQLENQMTELPFLTVKDRRSVSLVPVSEIYYLERVGRKTRIACLYREYWTSQSPAELLDSGSADSFIRCHQSYWVNLSVVLALKENEFYLPEDIKIPLSRTYRQEARDAFFTGLHHKTEQHL